MILVNHEGQEYTCEDSGWYNSDGIKAGPALSMILDLKLTMRPDSIADLMNDFDADSDEDEVMFDTGDATIS